MSTTLVSVAPPRRPRTPGFVYAIVALLLVILPGVLALTARQTPPPSIAEFAPQAIENISEVDQDRFGRHGASRPAEGGAREAEVTPSPSLAAVDVPRVRRCVGDPPRQIEDPQSPPCVPYWTGNNGGATARGVTSTTIRVAGHSGDAQDGARVNRDLISFFNRRFEFYGRQLELVPSGEGGQECVARRAQAQRIANELKAFARVGPNGGKEACFADEAARLGLIDIGADQWVPESDLAKADPYLWKYVMGFEELQANWARWTCTRLGKGNAEYSRDVTFALNPRKYGLVVQFQETPYEINVSWLERELASCGIRLEEKVVPDRVVLEDFASQSVTAVTRMKAAQVSTVLCYCPAFAAQYISGAATTHGYFPEWNTTDPMGSNLAIKAFWPNSEQRTSLFGYFTMPEHVPYEDLALNWALAEIEPGFQIRHSLGLYQDLEVYWQLLLLSSGIQMAGPRLTPTTFSRGLHKTRFPNPKLPPVQEGWVGFPGGAHTMIHDGHAAWWSDAAISPYTDDGSGAWCYAEGGRRYKLHEWTTGASGLFQQPCAPSPTAT